MFLFSQSATFMWLDIVILAVLLLAVFIGIKKGFVDQLFSMLGIVASIIGAILLTKLVANHFMSNESGLIFNKISEFVADKLGGNEYYSTTAIVWSDLETNGALINQVIESLGVPKLFVTLGLFNGLFSKFPTEAVTLEEYLPQTLTLYANYVIAFVILFILLTIAIWILKKTLNKLANLPILSALNKLLGIAFSVIKTFIIIVGVFVAASFISSLITPVGDFINNVAYQQSFIGSKIIKPIVEWIMTIIIK